MALRSNNPARILKAVVDLMKDRYLEKEYKPLNIEEILEAIKLTELKDDLKQWLDGVRAAIGIIIVKYCVLTGPHGINN